MPTLLHSRRLNRALRNVLSTHGLHAEVNNRILGCRALSVQGYYKSSISIMDLEYSIYLYTIGVYSYCMYVYVKRMLMLCSRLRLFWNVYGEVEVELK